jgi:WD40 repeat protein
MKRAYLSFASVDREAALSIAQQLRIQGVDLFIDLDRLTDNVPFSRRYANEIRSRDVLLFIQTKEALKTPLVQSELECAYTHHIEIVPLVFSRLNIRDTGEFRFLLHLSSIDFTQWYSARQHPKGMDELVLRLRTMPLLPQITARNAGQVRALYTLKAHTSWVRRVVFSPDNTLLVSSANDNTISIYDMQPARIYGGVPKLIERTNAHEQLVWALAFAPHHALLATGGSDSTIRFWDLNALPQIYEFSRMLDHRQAVYDLAFSTDGNYLASASHDQFAVVRDVRMLDVTGVARNSVGLQHISYVYSVTFSPDGQHFATGSRDSVVRLWQMPQENLQSLSQQTPRYLRGHATWINTVRFSPNNLLLASAGNDSTIRLWDVQHGEQFAVFDGHRDAVNTLAFSPDGSVLASAAKDDSVRLWNIDTLQEIAVLRGHERGVNALAFSPNGAYLVTGSGDTTIKVWSVPVGTRHPTSTIEMSALHHP